MPNTTAPRPTGTTRYNGIFKNMVNNRIQVYDDGVLSMTLAGAGVTAAGALDASGAGPAVLPQAVTIGGIAYTFPADNGDAGEQLETDGAGVLTWEAAT